MKKVHLSLEKLNRLRSKYGLAELEGQSDEKYLVADLEKLIDKFFSDFVMIPGHLGESKNEGEKLFDALLRRHSKLIAVDLLSEMTFDFGSRGLRINIGDDMINVMSVPLYDAVLWSGLDNETWGDQMDDLIADLQAIRKKGRKKGDYDE